VHQSGSPQSLTGRGVASASALTHARILLKANQGEAGPGWTDAAIAVAVEVNPATVARIRQRTSTRTGTATQLRSAAAARAKTPEVVAAQRCSRSD
jgi:Homeodomain-like domain